MALVSLKPFKKGIKFTEKENKVSLIFLLGGTKEKRVLHLRTIASIATIVQQKGFRSDWISAGNTEELKNLLILNNRKRLLNFT